MRAHCINRNIVECKGWRKSNDTATYYVLIETLWNVKYKSGSYSMASHSINRNIVECKGSREIISFKESRCINRNIVECKDHEAGTADRKAYVLIETLWNVKLQEIQMYAGHQKVLIETLWNVKWTKWECGFDSAYRINRNIVECKGRMTRLRMW